MDADTHNAIEAAIEISRMPRSREQQESLVWEAVSACTSLSMDRSPKCQAEALFSLLRILSVDTSRELQRLVHVYRNEYKL